MSKRISYSLLDPYLTHPLKQLYTVKGLPTKLPPECVVLAGHLFAILAGIGFYFSAHYWWGGIIAALGVALNHWADVWDGTHARATNQCRNGGELLDHFLDPISFSWYLIGISLACGLQTLGTIAVICLMAMAVLTNIKAKMTGEFTLSTIGPTEFKTALVFTGIILSFAHYFQLESTIIQKYLGIGFGVLTGFGVIQLVVNLIQSVKEVNTKGTKADTTEWVTVRSEDSCQKVIPKEKPILVRKDETMMEDLDRKKDLADHHKKVSF